MNDEFRKVCEALIGLIGKICIVHDTVPDGFNLSFGNDKIKITADINLKYDFTKKGESREIIKEFIEKSASSENVEELINRIFKK